MTNIFFEDEKVTENDLYFLCFMIEKIARKIQQRNRYIVNKISREEWLRFISLAGVLHCENPEKVADEWIQEYEMKRGSFDITAIDTELVKRIPSETQIGKVYMRLIVDTLQSGENYVDGMIRVYNDKLCEVLDDYNCGAYYEPSYFIVRAYYNGGF